MDATAGLVDGLEASLGFDGGTHAETDVRLSCGEVN